MLCNILGVFVAILRDVKKMLHNVDVALAQIEAETDVVLPLSDVAGAVSESFPMQDNDTRFRSNGRNTEAPENF